MYNLCLPIVCTKIRLENYLRVYTVWKRYVLVKVSNVVKVYQKQITFVILFILKFKLSFREKKFTAKQKAKISNTCP